MFLAGSVIFAMANKWKSTVISFVGGLVIIVAYIVSGSLMSDVENETIAGLSDVFGINTYAIETKYFTPAEKNTISPGFSGIILWNRLIWTGLGIIILLLSYFLYQYTNIGNFNLLFFQN